MSSYVFKIATQEPQKFLEVLREGLGAGSRIAKQVEEQMPKPAVEEPLDFGSLVRASNGTRKRVLWQQAPHIGGHYWINAFRDAEPWPELTDVEVLRVGLDGDAYENGARDLAAQIHKRLLNMLEDAISAERKNALEKAIQAVEELAP